jgi:O-antigen ligase
VEINLRYLQWAMMVVLVLGPSGMLGIKGGKNTGFYLLLLCSFVAMAIRLRPLGKRFTDVLREYWPFNLAMAGIVCALAIHEIFTGNFALKPFDMPSRLAFFAPLFWVLLLLPVEKLKVYQWGLVIGAALGTIALFIETQGGSLRPTVIFLMPIIPFGNLTFMMGILAVLSIGCEKQGQKLAVLLKIIAGFFALYALVLSQTRGAWLVFLALIVALIITEKRIKTVYKATGAVLLTFVVWSVFQFSSILRERIAVAHTDIEQYISGINLDTSIGIRFQLWKATWYIFKENPFVGVGFHGYSDELLKLAANGIITPFAATFHHAHNDILFIIATLGLAGLAALIALYVMPCIFFLSSIQDRDREISTVSRLGFALVLAFFVFGLTEVMFFYWTSNHAFYGMMMAILFAHKVRRQAELKNQYAEEGIQLGRGLSATLQPSRSKQASAVAQNGDLDV